MTSGVLQMGTGQGLGSHEKNELFGVFRLSKEVKNYLYFIMFVGFWINLLMLTPTIYMLQVFDRFLRSKSDFTLIAATMIATTLYGFMFFSEWFRSRVLVRLGVHFDDKLNRDVFRGAFEKALSSKSVNPVQYFSDLSQVRQFITGNGIIAATDVPWIPVYILIAFLLHPVLGLTIFAFVGIFLGLVLWNRKFLEVDELSRAQINSEANGYLQLKLRNAETVAAHGMLGRLNQRWTSLYERQTDANFAYHERLEKFRSLLKVVQYSQQSLTLAVGALLVIDGQLSIGSMIAANLIVSRACQPIQLLVQSWQEGASAWAAFGRLRELLASVPEDQPLHDVPLTGLVSTRDLTAHAQGREKAILDGINLTFQPGTISVIVGPSGSGKSTLVRNILGIWPERSGEIYFDGFEVSDLGHRALGSHVGYLPQDVEMFPGSVADNIAAFGAIEPGSIVAAAQLAGVHELILRLPKGYETEAGQAGQFLSGGQRQRLGIARAVYGQPKILVLDEPNASLDDVGEAALVRTLQQLRSAGSTIIVVAHRGSVMSIADRLILLQDGKLSAIKNLSEAHGGPVAIEE
jgi:ATP-binding cassette subfamily C exporter for protease/lipase